MIRIILASIITLAVVIVTSMASETTALFIVAGLLASSFLAGLFVMFVATFKEEE